MICGLQVELNVLTGAVTILKSDLIYDCGRSLNPAVDIGQVWKISLSREFLLLRRKKFS
jgi:xanthine dehydrogenase molybdopterin-binding subunit B